MCSSVQISDRIRLTPSPDLRSVIILSSHGTDRLSKQGKQVQSSKSGLHNEPRIRHWLLRQERSFVPRRPRLYDLAGGFAYKRNSRRSQAQFDQSLLRWVVEWAGVKLKRVEFDAIEEVQFTLPTCFVGVEWCWNEQISFGAGDDAIAAKSHFCDKISDLGKVLCLSILLPARVSKIGTNGKHV